ncbi:ParB/RepB/Spo0J family partition protein [Phormidium sp. LEGE 05292]|uniref:ParB/RepB/Spo0J family partition protein n=1 Tax=[Phormidium] sp. LEGE 05292 TaxID=767427 RepID=UPI00187F1C15|nr:ParB/RepB/Spo0J family partition protein [Phormidium sp. LEGE 05292]MBE9224037.1 ParB/RepB/Spo0J family partition protein [Phormidium sp. LEGE 05292]
MSSSKKDQPYTSKLRGVAALLGEPEVEAAAQLIEISAIGLPSKQPRRYFDPEKLQQLAASIKEHGILEPLLVRSMNGGSYELVAGERRYRAAQIVGITSVPVVVRELSDEQALVLSLIENLQREDLNPVEETEGILQLLAFRLQVTLEEARGLLYRMQNELKGKVTQNVLGNSQGQEIEELFSSLGLMSWESFVSSRLPLLNLPEDIIGVLREGRIEYTKACAIARIKDIRKREEFLEEAIEENWSLSQIKERIKAIRPAKSEPTQNPLKNRMKEVSRQLLVAKFWDNPKKQKALEKLLSQMEALLVDEQ